MPRACLLALLCAASGCATATPFTDRAVLWHDPDDAPIPVPQKREVTEIWSAAVRPVVDQLERVFDLDIGDEAEDVNALDEVPDSSWFENRVRVTVEDVSAGGTPAADPALPLTIVSGKTDGATPGFVVTDARGDRYLLKFDPPGQPGLATGTDAVASRLYHAAGWNVPSEKVLEVDVDADLRLTEKSRLKAEDGERRLDDKALAALLARADRGQDGRLRAVAVRFIGGKIIGQWSYMGRRADDANDRIRHENRRSLRALVVLAAWVNNVDTLDTNTLDTYVGEPGRGHVVHYVIDFGTAFGSYAVRPMEPWMGHMGYIDPGRLLASTAGFGVVAQPPWIGAAAEERRKVALERWPELGGFSADDFDPSRWSPLWRNPAFARSTARDRYWGAKQIFKIDRPMVRAAVAAGRYRAAAAERLEEVLWARRQAILRRAFDEVAPLDRFRVAGGSLCFRDLWIDAGLGAPAGVTYRAKGTLADGERPARGGDECVPVARHRGVHRVTLAVRREGERGFGPRVRVYIADGERLVGIERGSR